MKKYIYLNFAMVVVIGAFGVTAQAQSRNRQQLNVSLPFAFNVGNTVLPAGKYKISIVNPSSDRSVLKFANTNGQKSIMVHTSDVIGSSAQKARLIFRRYGQQYFLNQVWMSAESTGLSIPHSRAEQNLRDQLGGAAYKFDVIAWNVQ